MAHVAFGLVGVVLTLAPDAFVELYERIAFENPEDVASKAWLPSAVRIEGLAFALASAAGGRSYAWLVKVSGVAGVVAFCFPRQYLETGLRIAYDRPDELVWREGFVTTARVLGALSVLLSVRELWRRRGREGSPK